MSDREDYDRDRRSDRRDVYYQVFCGNFEYDASEREVERLFTKYGDVQRVDMKTDKRDAETAIRHLDRKEFGYKRRKLRVEWAKHRESNSTRTESKPSSTLFVVNFDVRKTRERDLERHFEPYGRLVRVEIKRNYAFVQFETSDQAAEALRATHLSSFQGRAITVEFVTNEDPHSKARAQSYSRSRSRSPRRRSRSRSRSRSRGRSASRSPSRSRRRSPSRSRSRSVSKGRGKSASPGSRSVSRSPQRSVSRSPVRSRSRSRSASR